MVDGEFEDIGHPKIFKRGDDFLILSFRFCVLFSINQVYLERPPFVRAAMELIRKTTAKCRKTFCTGIPIATDSAALRHW